MAWFRVEKQRHGEARRCCAMAMPRKERRSNGIAL
nr:MAG TPA: SAMP Motif [Caudoviricetes sp.]